MRSRALAGQVRGSRRRTTPPRGDAVAFSGERAHGGLPRGTGSDQERDARVTMRANHPIWEADSCQGRCSEGFHKLGTLQEADVPLLKEIAIGDKDFVVRMQLWRPWESYATGGSSRHSRKWPPRTRTTGTGGRPPRSWSTWNPFSPTSSRRAQGGGREAQGREQGDKGKAVEVERSEH